MGKLSRWEKLFSHAAMRAFICAYVRGFVTLTVCLFMLMCEAFVHIGLYVYVCTKLGESFSMAGQALNNSKTVSHGIRCGVTIQEESISLPSFLTVYISFVSFLYLFNLLPFLSLYLFIFLSFSRCVNPSLVLYVLKNHFLFALLKTRTNIFNFCQFSIVFK